MSTHLFYQAIKGNAARFRQRLPQARALQQQLLLNLLRHNAATEYGHRHGFDAIRDYRAFRERVPVAHYEDLQAPITRMTAGETGVLTRDAPIAFEETGGSSGGHKLIPCTPQALDAFRQALLSWLDDLALHHPAIAGGKSYWSISPATRATRMTPGGIPIGHDSDAAYFGENLAPLLPATLAVPPGVAGLSDITAWRDATCSALLACEELVLISVWSPTFLLDLLSHLRNEADALTARLLAGGRITTQRASLVREVLGGSNPDYQRLWPGLVVVSCWDQAASRAYAVQLQEQLPGVTLQGKGLLATECVISLPLCDLTMPVLALDSGFFELRDEGGRCIEVCDGVVGNDYEVLLTTWGGLYRYAIGDRVRVRGYAGEAPLLEFLGRSGVTSDICGEKLTEDFVLHALQPSELRFALLMPAGRGYVLMVDAEEISAPKASDQAQPLDAALCANPQYAYARKLGQLAPLRIQRCVSPLASWQHHALQQGRRLGDIKPPVLCPDAAGVTLFTPA